MKTERQHPPADEAAQWCAWHRTLAQLDPTAPPQALLPAGENPPPRRVGVLAGSFNPLTDAHLALARAATAAGHLDTLLFALSVRTVDKEEVSGLALEDRLLMLDAVIRAEPNADWRIVLLNRGLYVEQAEALRAALPNLDALWFVVGWDKIVQIFDRRYYPAGESALVRLFALARFLVAPRGKGEAADLHTLLTRPENQPYAAAVTALPLDPAWRDVSSTHVRQGRPEPVPPTVAAYLDRLGLFRSTATNADRTAYAARCAALAARCTANPGR